MYDCFETAKHSVANYHIIKQSWKVPQYRAQCWNATCQDLFATFGGIHTMRVWVTPEAVLLLLNWLIQYIQVWKVP